MMPKESDNMHFINGLREVLDLDPLFAGEPVHHAILVYSMRMTVSEHLRSFEFWSFEMRR